MSFDEQKVENTVLALVYPTSLTEQGITRAWKGHDWEVMNRLPAKGFISDPRSQAKSVLLTEEGARRSEQLFNEMFRKAV